jgi:hypothetical protein
MIDMRAVSNYNGSMKRRGFLQGVAAAIAFVSAAASGFGAAVANVCSKVTPVKRRVILPPVPKWNKETDDIDRLDYMRRSEEFERSFLPPDLVFPREGQIWEAVRDCEVSGRMMRQQRTVFWGKVKLRKGDRIRILPLGHPKPLQVNFQCLAPDQAHHLFWMRTARTVPGQTEETAYFHELFSLVVAT